VHCDLQYLVIKEQIHRRAPWLYVGTLSEVVHTALRATWRHPEDTLT